MTKYKVKNLAKDTRKFRDSWIGKDILVESGKTVITNRPPKEGNIWKVEIYIEKTEEKILKKEVISKKMKKYKMLSKTE